MTRDEAERFIARLESGERFAARFQEQEWGLDACADGTFREWRRDAMAEPPDDRADEQLTRDALRERLMGSYSYEVLSARLRR